MLTLRNKTLASVPDQVFQKRALHFLAIHLKFLIVMTTSISHLSEPNDDPSQSDFSTQPQFAEPINVVWQLRVPFHKEKVFQARLERIGARLSTVPIYPHIHAELGPLNVSLPVDLSNSPRDEPTFEDYVATAILAATYTVTGIPSETWLRSVHAVTKSGDGNVDSEKILWTQGNHKEMVKRAFNQEFVENIYEIFLDWDDVHNT